MRDYIFVSTGLEVVAIVTVTTITLWTTAFEAIERLKKNTINKDTILWMATTAFFGLFLTVLAVVIVNNSIIM